VTQLSFPDVPTGDLVAYTATAAALIDRAFRQGMAAGAKQNGAALRERHPRGFAPVLIDFRTSLGRPDGAVGPGDFAEVNRYLDQADVERSLQATIERGAIVRDAAGTIRATEAGHAFVDDLYATQDMSLREHWASCADSVIRLAPLLRRLVQVAAAAADEPGTFRAMEPAYEPAGVGNNVLVLNRLSALRYARSDAHAHAWREAGLSAAEMVALQGSDDPAKDAIERRTNELAAPIFAGLSAAERAALQADLRRLNAE
jgi:hypothetical protein